MLATEPDRPRVTLIAEVASNAGRSLRLATAFIETFAAAGADIIKFQWTRSARLAPTDPQAAWFRQTDWSREDMAYINATCRRNGVEPLWTIYHPGDIDAVADHPAVKVGCGEAHLGTLAAVILAGGFQAIYVSEGIVPAHVSYRHDPRVHTLGVCAHYPAPRGVVTHRFPNSGYSGWSDHSEGFDESMLAVLLGATILERHVQIPIQARPASSWELTAEQFGELRRRVDASPRRFLGRWGEIPQEAPGPLQRP